MDGQLVQVCLPSNSVTELIASVAALRQEFAELRATNQRLERENLEFRQQAGYWKSRHNDSLQRIAALERKLEQLEGEKRDGRHRATKLGKGESSQNVKPFIETLRVANPVRQSRASSREASLAWGRATVTTKRRQRDQTLCD
jgi:cell division protein FtsB